jgi:hypothetical protein
MFIRIFNIFFILGVLVMYSGNACNKLAIEDRQAPPYLAKYHARFDGYYTMPETAERLDEGISDRCFYIESDTEKEESLRFYCGHIIMNICGEVENRFLDKNLYFIDRYSERFHNFTQLISQAKYSDIERLLFHQAPYWGIVNNLWGLIVRLSREHPNEGDLLFRITLSLDLSLKKCSTYLEDWVKNSADLFYSYTHLLGDSFVQSPEYKAMYAEVEKMLAEGITLGKE